MTGRESDPLPSIAITVGDVAGVGPELAIRCASLPEVASRCRPILYGPANVIAEIASRLATGPPSHVHDAGTISVGDLQPGTFDSLTGLASFQAVEHAIQDTLSGAVAGIVTGPIQKEAWHSAGVEFPGHTEMLAEMTGVDDFCMMLTSDQVTCVLVTIHVPLLDVPPLLSVDSIHRAIQLGSDAMRARLGRSPRIKVCGLNPHAGENGLFSHGEEANHIVPAIELAKQSGLDVSGPLPPDTAFTPRMREETDVYICMYHDQGLIPLKALAFEDAVNVTLGLPIVRTSVDHGTALDLAWQGVADHRSMLAAIHMAVDLIQDESTAKIRR
ncbi:MAG: 4-hydroxythreonine-4-phosphate dehydrogenase PdxA [Rubripirellula sp.]